jgi:hypothetical protein
LIGGFLAEVAVFAVVIPVFIKSGARGVLYAALSKYSAGRPADLPPDGRGWDAVDDMGD